MQHVFIIGSRGLPAKYGGFETFVDELVSNQKSAEIKYHVANLSDRENKSHYTYKGADVFNIKSRNLGGARVIFYDLDAINYSLEIIRKEGIKNPIFYILGNTIGAFITPMVKKIHAVGGLVFVNPDGLEWRRSKWNYPVRKYLKYAERKMVEQTDLIIADNQGIEDYLKLEYKKPFKSTVLAYGTDTEMGINPDLSWFEKQAIASDGYYLVVGRFVPENNYEAVIRSFMASTTEKDLVIVTNKDDGDLYETLLKSTGFDKDSRIKFVGTVYDKDTLKAIRERAFAYIHGHEVGGTNPSLLEAMWSSKLNLVLDVDFNRNVTLDSARYWQKDSLTDLINKVDVFDEAERIPYRQMSRKIVCDNYTWQGIVNKYEELFLNEG
ncbi:DUF1972 domain-containing protein [Streptococcaceae bacterium ESL0687]|nr:DUF1972 domain-containing protein [Streptococcaceae bacterium ESL0687]